jgi:methyl-accepting chemotaxis protein
MNNKKKMSISAQITFLVIIVSILNVAIITGISYTKLRASYLEAKLLGTTEVAISVVNNLYERAKAGEFSMEEAQERSLTILGSVRFEGDNYMTVLDKDATILESAAYERGTDGKKVVDGSGKVHMFKDIVESALASKDDIADQISFHGTMPGSDKIVAKVGGGREFRPWEWTVMASISEESLSAAVQSTLVLMLMIAVAIIVSTVIGVQFVFVRPMTRALTDITSGLEDSTGSVSNSATSLEDSSQKLAEGTNEQAASVQEIVATIEESASMIKKTDESSTFALKLAQEAKAHATKGHKEMVELMSAMDRIDNANKEISKIIKMIDEVAMQTNILSLNAAVEAEKAGEAGKGFAVVAEEVRNLAQRSAQAAKETAVLIDGNVTLTQNAVRISAFVEDALRKIDTSVNKVKELLDEISTASQEQVIGASQISQAITQIESVIQTQAGVATESSQSATTLQQECEHLKAIAGDLVSIIRNPNSISASSGAGLKLEDKKGKDKHAKKEKGKEASPKKIAMGGGSSERRGPAGGSAQTSKERLLGAKAVNPEDIIPLDNF